MSNFNQKTTKNVADIVAQIMSEKLHPNQQKLDVHEPEKDELTSNDFKKLRAGKKADVKEEAEQLKEYESKGGSYTHKGTYGYAGKGAEHGDTDYAKENELAKAADKPKKPNRAKYGARQNFKRSTRVNEGFSSMFDALQEKGLKGLAEAMSHQAKTTMKHIPNPTPAQKQAAKDIKPGVGGYRDRIAMLKDAGVKEEVEELDELSTSTLKSYIGGAQKDRAAQSDSKNSGDREQAAYAKKQSVKRTLGIVDAKSRLSKEEVESIDEVKMADLPSTKVQGRAYGASKPEPHALDLAKGPKDKELKNIDAEKKKKFSEMVNLYQNGGMKSFMEALSKE